MTWAKTMEWNDIAGLAHKMLNDEYHDLERKWLGEAYIAYTKARNSFDSNKGIKFTTYFAQCFRYHMIEVFRYQGHLVHIPLGQRKDVKLVTKSIDQPIDEEGNTLADMMATPEEVEQYPVIDVNVPPKMMFEYNIIIEAVRHDMSESKYLRNILGYNDKDARTISARITYLRRLLKRSK